MKIRLTLLLLLLCLTPTARAEEPVNSVGYYLRGKERMKKADLTGAIADSSEAIRRDNTFAAAFMLRGEAYVQQREWSKAVDDFTRAIGLEPKDDKIYLLRAQAYRSWGREADAKADEERAAKVRAANEPKTAAEFVTRSDELAARGKYEEAIADYSQALKLAPTLVEALVERGESYSRLKREDEAIADFTRAIALEPRNDHAFYQRGSSHLGRYNAAGALTDFDAALALKPNEEIYLIGRALALRELRRHDEANAVQRALKIRRGRDEPTTTQGYFERGREYSERGEWGNAVDDLSEVLKRDPAHFKALWLRAESYRAQNKLTEARADEQRARDGQGGTADDFYKRGEWFMRDKEFNDAVADFSAALRRDPTDYRAYFQRAYSYSQQEQTAKAIADYTSFIELKPNFGLAVAHSNRAISLRKLGKIAEAEADEKRAAELQSQK